MANRRRLGDELPVVSCVAETFYEPLSNGDGELEITVATDWRGWLGPFLFVALLAKDDGDQTPLERG